MCPVAAAAPGPAGSASRGVRVPSRIVAGSRAQRQGAATAKGHGFPRMARRRSGPESGSARPPAHPVAHMFSGHDRPVAILGINKHPSGDAKPLWHRVWSDSGQNVRDDL